MGPRLGAVTLLAIVLLARADAWAEVGALANGRAHYLGARFGEAERAFESVTEDAAASRADLVEAFRYLAVLRLVRGLRADAEEAALRGASLDRGLTPPEGAPPTAAALFDAARSHVPAGGLSCSLELPPRPVASSPVGARVHVVGDLGGLVATASLRCGGTEHRGTPERDPAGDAGAAFAEISVDAGPAGRRTTCAARLLTSANIVLAEASGSFVAREAVVDAMGGGDRVRLVADVDGPGSSGRADHDDDRRGGGFPWVWVGVGAGVAALGAVVAALLLTSGSDEAYLGAPTVVSAE
jgi:hypothetical protein